MSKIKKTLEESLELCESMTLDDQAKYPQAQRLIPILRELLEQEEECVHSFNHNSGTGIAICSACGVTDLESKPQENGVWIPMMKNGNMLVESTDYTHDVTIQITGDFETINQMREYAKMIANRLNTFSKE